MPIAVDVCSDSESTNHPWPCPQEPLGPLPYSGLNPLNPLGNLGLSTGAITADTFEPRRSLIVFKTSQLNITTDITKTSHHHSLIP